MDFKIPFGTDFRKRIRDALRESDVLIVVIGPKWLGPGRRGRVRIHDQTDQVRIEVETAVNLNIPIIPVLVERGQMPAPETLPESLSDFAYLNAAEIDVGRDFDQHMEDLVDSINLLIQEKVARSAPVEKEAVGTYQPAPARESKKQREPKQPRNGIAAVPSKDGPSDSAPGAAATVLPAMVPDQDPGAKIDPPAAVSPSVVGGPPSQAASSSAPQERDQLGQPSSLADPAGEAPVDAREEAGPEPDSTAQDSSGALGLAGATPALAASERVIATLDGPALDKPESESQAPDESRDPTSQTMAGSVPGPASESETKAEREVATSGGGEVELSNELRLDLPERATAENQALHEAKDESQSADPAAGVPAEAAPETAAESQVELHVADEHGSAVPAQDEVRFEFSDQASANGSVPSEARDQPELSLHTSPVQLDRSEQQRPSESGDAGDRDITVPRELNVAGWRTRKKLVVAVIAAAIVVFLLFSPRMLEHAGVGAGGSSSQSAGGSSSQSAKTEPVQPEPAQNQPPAATEPSAQAGNVLSGDGRPLATGGNNGPTLPSPRVEACGTKLGDLPAASNTGGPLAALTIKPIFSGAERLRTVAFSPDAKTFAVAGDDRKIHLFDAETYTLIKTLPGHEDAIYSIVFASDGTKLASAGWDGTARVWNVTAGVETNKFDAKAQKQGRDHEENKQYAVAFATDRPGKYLLSAGADGMIWIWNLSHNNLDRARGGHNEPHHTAVVRSLSFAPNGSDEFVSAGNDGTIRFYLPKGGTKKVEAHKGAAFRALFSPTGDRVVSAGYDGKLKIWRTKGQELLKTFDASAKYLIAAGWSPDGKRVASAGKDRTIRLWDAESPGTQLLKTFDEEHKDDVEALAFDPLRNRLLSVSEDKTVKVWDVKTGKSLLTIVPYENGDYLAFDPRGCYAGSADVERRFKIGIEGFSKDQEITADMKKALFLANGFGELKPTK